MDFGSIKTSVLSAMLRTNFAVVRPNPTPLEEPEEFLLLSSRETEEVLRTFKAKLTSALHGAWSADTAGGTTFTLLVRSEPCAHLVLNPYRNGKASGIRLRLDPLPCAALTAA